MTTTTALFPAEAPFAGTVLHSGNARADLAQAMGQCEAGQRVTVVVRGRDLPRLVDLLQEAARRLLPLVVRAAFDEGDACLFAIADTGACVLIAMPDEVAVVHLLARLLAERALIPVVVGCTAGATARQPAALPTAAGDLLGDAADFVPAATPAQELWFGKERRRVVRWFDPERPVLRGQQGDVALATLQRAGVAAFVHSPVPQLLQAVAAEVQAATGVAWSAADMQDTDKAEVLVVGLRDAMVGGAAMLAAGGKGPRTGFVTLNCLRPFPTSWLGVLRGKRAIVVLSAAETSLAGEPPLVREVRAAMDREQGTDRAHRRAWKDKEVPTLHTALAGLAGAELVPADLAAFVAECAHGDGRALVYLGVEFAPLTGTLRKRTVLHETLRRAHPGIERLGLRTAAPAALAAVPQAPRRLAPPVQSEPTHDSLTRSWDLVAAAALTGASSELAPDPYLTAGSVPALTSLFRGNAAAAELPALDPAKCTGCGACWTACPDGALLPAVLGGNDLLEAGMRAAATAGQSAEALRPVLGRLQKALPKAIADGAGDVGTAVRQAAALALARIDEERRGPMSAAAEALASNLDALPVARCEAFFPRTSADGNLLVLALDPDACKGCNLCVSVCPTAALTAAPRMAASVDQTRRAAAQWRSLPDTAGEVIAAAREQAEPGLLGALELSRHCLLALACGDDAEPGSGARIALRSVLATVEAHLQPKLQQHLHELDQVAATFGERIRELLASALPITDLDALHEGLATLGMGAVALSTLAGRLDAAQASGRVDAARLQRLVDTARAVADLRWRVAEGSTGRGRARAGLVLTGGDTEVLAGRFPWNPFAAPAVLDGSPEAGYRALGLLQGQAEALMGDFALLRRANAVLQRGAPGPRALTFAELTPAERELFPPLWLVADASVLQRGGLAQMVAVLGGDLPIKVLLLSTSLSTSPPAAEPLTAAMLALAHRQAFVLQSSVAHRDHLASGVLAACRHPGPALLHVLAPSPRAANATPDLTLMLAAAAVNERSFPLLRYDPLRPGAFGQKLSLDGNPEPTEAGTTDPARLANWQTLQELAGVRTPFTHDVELRAAVAVATAHQKEIAELQARHASELQAARGVVETELLSRLQHKLTALAGGRRP
jgi:ferredoxin